MNEDSAEFIAYNQAIEDAKAAIRAETTNADGSEFFSATFINAIARKCSPHVYVNRLAAAATAAPVEQSGPSPDEAVRRARDWLKSYEAEKHYEGIDQMFRYVAQLITDLLPNEGAR